MVDYSKWDGLASDSDDEAEPLLQIKLHVDRLCERTMDEQDEDKAKVLYSQAIRSYKELLHGTVRTVPHKGVDFSDMLNDRMAMPRCSNVLFCQRASTSRPAPSKFTRSLNNHPPSRQQRSTARKPSQSTLATSKRWSSVAGPAWRWANR